MTHHIAGGSVKTFESIVATSTGIPLAPFNRIFVCVRGNRDQLHDALQWMRERDDPFRVTVRDETTEWMTGVASDYGLKKGNSQPGMVLKDLEPIGESTHDLEITSVRGPAGLDQYVTVFSAVFDVSHELASRAHPEGYIEDDRIELILGAIDGEPVACGTLCITTGVAGVYSVGVLEEFRRRGFGQAMTKAVLTRGRKAGCRIGALQSSKAGYPLYQRLGFETVDTYHHFDPV